MKIKLLIFATLLFFTLLASAQPKKVAVYVMGEDAGVNKVLGSKLQTAIASSEGYTAIERTASFLTELSKEQKYQRTGAVDDSDISRLGKQFGVQYVCVAAVSEAFNEKYITARLIDVESAQVEGTASSSGAIRGLPDIMSAANTVSDELLSSLKKGRQSNGKKVAVYIVKNDAAKSIGRVLGDKLVAGFASSGRYVAIERTTGFLAQLGKEQKYQRTGAVDDSDISRLGKQFGVQYVCVADVSDVFGEKFISARLIDVETAEIVNSHDAGSKINQMDDCVRIANEIASILSKGTFAEQAEAQRRVELRNAQLKPQGLVDLGLPSGTLWKDKNEAGGYNNLFTYEEAVIRFGNSLPTKTQLEELKNECRWEWSSNGYKVTGPNGSSIFLPAAGARDSLGEIYNLGISGDYLSSTPSDSEFAWCLSFMSVYVGIGRVSSQHSARSVRLVQNP